VIVLAREANRVQHAVGPAESRQRAEVEVDEPARRPIDDGGRQDLVEHEADAEVVVAVANLGELHHRNAALPREGTDVLVLAYRRLRLVRDDGDDRGIRYRLHEVAEAVKAAEVAAEEQYACHGDEGARYGCRASMLRFQSMPRSFSMCGKYACEKSSTCACSVVLQSQSRMSTNPSLPRTDRSDGSS
jgi:hypothetical protein